MKVTSILVGALAAVATAAPTAEKVEERSIGGAAFGGFGGVNNFAFANLDLAYLAQINGFGGFANIQNLAINNGFDVLQFQGLFQNDVFDVQSLLLLQQLAVFDQLAAFQVFNSFDLSSLLFNNIGFGLINNVGAFNFNGLIDAALIPQISAVVQQGLGASPFSSSAFSSGFSSGFSSSSSNVNGVPSAGSAVDSVTADEFNAQEGGASLE